MIRNPIFSFTTDIFANLPWGGKVSWAKNYSWRKSNFAQLKISFWRRGPTGIKCRQAFALLKGVGGRRGWGPGEGAEGWIGYNN